MRRILLSAGMAAVLLGGCGNDAQPEGSSPETTTTATATATEETSATDETVTGTESPSHETETTAAGEPEATSGEKSPRGNLIKQVGERAGMTNEAGDDLWNFSITQIEPNYTCTSEWAEASANGNFIALHIESETTAALADDEWANSVDFNPYDFSIFSTDGQRENDSVGNSYGCVQDSDSLPSMIGPGEKVSGILVLDSQHETGYIAFKPAVVGGGGWEWEF